jgi:regulator of sirC expression with transglutaminase-like and TPR domain
MVPIGYAFPKSVSTIFTVRLSTVLGILTAWCLSLPVDISRASTPGGAVLDALLEVDSAHASLCPARLQPDEVRSRVAALGEKTRAQLVALEESKAATPAAVVRVMNGIIFGHGELRPSQDLHDPCNLLVSGVLTRGQGYCVGIAGVYLSVAEELGLPIKALATPTHVFLRYDDGKTRINIETFNGGAAVPDEQYVTQQRIAPVSVKKGVFLEALSTDRFLAQVYNNLGVIYSERREFEKAAQEYDKALRLDRHLPAAWYNLGKDQVARKDFEAALKSFSKALRLNPNDTWALNNRGMVYQVLGEREKARADFEAALRIDPSFESARIGLQGTRAEGSSGDP